MDISVFDYNPDQKRQIIGYVYQVTENMPELWSLLISLKRKGKLMVEKKGK